jgi:hypothetical protein
MTKKKTTTSRHRTATRKTVARSPRHPRKADFDDMEAVRKEIAKILDIEEYDLSIKNGSTPNGHGEAYTVSTRGGHKQWIVMRDDDEFEAAAVDGVKDDLNESPENFDPNFIRGHIDMYRLRHDLSPDVSSSNTDYVADLDPSRFWDEAPGHGIDIPDDVQASLDAGDEPREPTGEEEEEFEEDMTREQLKDPMGYLEDIYGREDAQGKAMEIGSIDVDAAAEEAVRIDGAAHFLCSYDGNHETSPSGFIYWRHN